MIIILYYINCYYYPGASLQGWDAALYGGCRAKFGGELNLTVWRCVLEPPIIMSANYFNLGGGADHSSW